jgi:hypothetical protein
MKIKSALFVLIFVLAASIVDAQIVVKGERIVNAGLGLGSTLYSGSYYKTTVPPISLSAEYILKDDLLEKRQLSVLGGTLGFRLINGNTRTGAGSTAILSLVQEATSITIS